MTDLTIGDETFKVIVEGDALKPCLMLSNSLGTDLAMWDGQMPALTRDFRVIRYDPRGHGGSRAGEDDPTSIARLGRDALAILDALGIEKVHWVGLSMGGAVGLWLLVNAPDRIDRAVLANTAARLSTPEAWNARIASVLAGAMADNAEATIERWFSSAYAASHPDRVETIHAMLRGARPQGYAAACGALRDMDLRAATASIGHEVLIVTGRDDPVIPSADAQTLISGIAGASHVALDARHMSNIEAEADFNAAVLAFLSRPARATTSAASRPRAPRKTPAAKPAAPVKRGGAGRRSNPARNPLQATPKKTPAKKAAARKAQRVRKEAEPRRRAVATRNAARAGSKATVKRKAPTKTTPKAASTRRATPTASARGAVKKAKPAKRGIAKTPAKKAAAKSPTKTAMKKLPAPRRKPTKKPGRPTGRRKS